jgi:hypothetical protein
MKFSAFLILPLIATAQAQRGGHSAPVCASEDTALAECYADDAAKDLCAICLLSTNGNCGSIETSSVKISDDCVTASECSSNCSTAGEAYKKCFMTYECGEESDLAVN